MIARAPREPTPLTMFAAILTGSPALPSLREKLANMVAPTQMKMMVRNPALITVLPNGTDQPSEQDR
jgi:hypothetical protein